MLYTYLIMKTNIQDVHRRSWPENRETGFAVYQFQSLSIFGSVVNGQCLVHSIHSSPLLLCNTLQCNRFNLLSEVVFPLTGNTSELLRLPFPWLPVWMMLAYSMEGKPNGFLCLCRNNEICSVLVFIKHFIKKYVWKKGKRPSDLLCVTNMHIKPSHFIKWPISPLVLWLGWLHNICVPPCVWSLRTTPLDPYRTMATGTTPHT